MQTESAVLQSSQSQRAGIKLLLLAVLGAVLMDSHLASAGQKAASNDSAKAKAPAIREGVSLFRANCSPCHGLGATGGGRGPDLTSGRWTHGSTDAAIFRTISQGVPGTEMPANGFEDSEIWAIIAYLRSLAPKHPVVFGDPVKGKKIFETASCSTCHMVKGTGGRLGPDLSRVAASRSLPYLIDSIRQPDKQLSSGMTDPNNHYGLPLVYDTVTVITVEGDKITGVARNEDTFSVQLLTEDQNLQSFLKKEVKSVIHEHKSLMPAYSEDTLSASQLQDLIAYLETLRGTDDSGRGKADE